METSTPDMAEAKQFADAIHAKFPGKLLAYNCSPSFNWKRKLTDAQIADYQKVLPSQHGSQFRQVTSKSELAIAPLRHEPGQYSST